MKKFLLHPSPQGSLFTHFVSRVIYEILSTSSGIKSQELLIEIRKKLQTKLFPSSATLIITIKQ